MKNKHTINRRAIVLLILIVVFAMVMAATTASPTVNVDADDVVKMTRIVNYHDKMGNAHYGAKMNIIVFKRKG